MPTVVSIIRAHLVSKTIYAIVFDVLARTRIFSAETRDRIFSVTPRADFPEAIVRDRIFTAQTRTRIFNATERG